jgi:hypothetical protein
MYVVIWSKVLGIITTSYIMIDFHSCKVLLLTNLEVVSWTLIVLGCLRELRVWSDWSEPVRTSVGWIRTWRLLLFSWCRQTQNLNSVHLPSRQWKLSCNHWDEYSKWRLWDPRGDMSFLCCNPLTKPQLKLNYPWQTRANISSLHMYWLFFSILKIFSQLCDHHIYVCIFKICDKICDQWLTLSSITLL